MNEMDIAMRQQIIEAASGRFQHYGYQKTTMAEIAEDCDMSPGNLYRYFTGKIDIATEIARADSIAQIERLRPLLECQFRTARQRLTEIMFEILRNTFHQLENNERLVELVQTVARENPRFLTESQRRERRVLAVVLEKGRKSGEFQVTEVNKAAAMIQIATIKFNYPQIFTEQPLEILEEELQFLLDMLFCGLLNPDFTPPAD